MAETHGGVGTHLSICSNSATQVSKTPLRLEDSQGLVPQKSCSTSESPVPRSTLKSARTAVCQNPQSAASQGSSPKLRGPGVFLEVLRARSIPAVTLATQATALQMSKLIQHGPRPHTDITRYSPIWGESDQGQRPGSIVRKQKPHSPRTPGVPGTGATRFISGESGIGVSSSVGVTGPSARLPDPPPGHFPRLGLTPALGPPGLGKATGPGERPRPQDGRAHMPLRTAAGAAPVSYCDELKGAESVALRGGGCAAERRVRERFGLGGGGTGAAESLRARLAARRRHSPRRPHAPPRRRDVRLVAGNIRTLWSPLRASDEPRPNHCPRHAPSRPLTVGTAPPPVARARAPRSDLGLRGYGVRKCSADPGAVRGRTGCCYPPRLSGCGRGCESHLLCGPFQEQGASLRPLLTNCRFLLLGFLVYRRASVTPQKIPRPLSGAEQDGHGPDAEKVSAHQTTRCRTRWVSYTYFKDHDLGCLGFATPVLPS
ncbi:uncharacterized protein LOC113930371 [Zalophus californianus]|uniref:Uncharacterized protein LOC113930371 n=1 Tax=Zalophus californianus TaxID=9704 RepID=A0A6P9F2J9_ZALCA|nr:uncharacterized protein LOC113930371 [Zalophus californianus]